MQENKSSQSRLVSRMARHTSWRSRIEPANISGICSPMDNNTYFTFNIWIWLSIFSHKYYRIDRWLINSALNTVSAFAQSLIDRSSVPSSRYFHIKQWDESTEKDWANTKELYYFWVFWPIADNFEGRRDIRPGRNRMCLDKKFIITGLVHLNLELKVSDINRMI